MVDGGQGQVTGHVAGQLPIAFVEELDSHWEDCLHYTLLAVVLIV